jgi:Tfp pilus assembly protein PilF
MSCDWDWQGSQAEFTRAFQINPDDATARNWHGALLWTQGRLEESLAEYKRGLQAEPLSTVISATLGRALWYLRRDDEATDQLRRTIQTDPAYLEAHLYLGWVYEKKGMLSEAIAELRQTVRLSEQHPRFVGALGHAYAISGQKKTAEESLAWLREQAKHRYVSPFDMAVVYAGLKDTDEMFKYLKMAYEERSFWMVILRLDPRFESIHGDPRYQDIMRRMHLTP